MAKAKISDVLDNLGKGKRVNITSLAGQGGNCSGEIVEVMVDGLELKPEATTTERLFVTESGLVIKIMKPGGKNEQAENRR